MELAPFQRKLRRCKVCRKKKPDVSHKGKCWRCALKIMKATANQLHRKEGEYYDKWKAAVKKSAARL